MNCSTLLKSALCVALLAVSASCHNEKPAKPAQSTGKDKAAIEKLVIRYVDEDSLLNNYNLAKDINEAMLRRQNQFDAAQTQRSNEIAKFGRSMEQKYKNNGYLTEESFNADQNKLQQMQNNAQNYLGNLQQTIQNELNQGQMQLQDSITNYMKDYARAKGYDLILRKSATLYIDERFDVTNEVIEGLNKRYNKVEK